MWSSQSAQGGASFTTSKAPVSASRAMVVTNHPLASAAATEIMALGGNAIDGAICALITLTVVEPMMVGIMGGGTTLLRTADGKEHVVDGLCQAPSAATATSYQPLSDQWPDYMEVAGRHNSVGPRSMAVPGNLLTWYETHAKYGVIDWATLLAPAIRHARNGFGVSHYFVACSHEALPDLRENADIAKIFLMDGAPLHAGQKLIQADYADTLERIAEHGADELCQGKLGAVLGEWLVQTGALLSLDDVRSYKPIWREPVHGKYRGYDIVGPPPPCSGGVHVVQMLKLLESFDMSALGFGTVASAHLLAEVMKIAASDRSQATGDPDFVAVPVNKLISDDYAKQRVQEINLCNAGTFSSALSTHESPNTTHVTVADELGNIVCATHTIHSLFGARTVIPGTGVMANNYMYLFDPHPNNAMSIEPGKRVTSAQSPLIIYKAGQVRYALGLPGGARIYTSAMQTVVNLIDHKMNLQQAVEAPRLWTQGQHLELEPYYKGKLGDALAQMGHVIDVVPHIGGGMNAIQFGSDGSMIGAACWRADGTPMGIGGGLAKKGVSFWPEGKPKN